MSSIKSKMTVLLLLAALSSFTSACSVDRADPKAVAEAAFQAILARDYGRLQQLAGSGAGIPSEQEWKDATFIRDYTAGERIKQRWTSGDVSGFTLAEFAMEDFQGPAFQLERLVKARFILSGESYVATFPMVLTDGQWSPGSGPNGGGFFIRFEESVG